MHRLRIVPPRKGDDLRLADGDRPNIDDLTGRKILEVADHWRNVVYEQRMGLSLTTDRLAIIPFRREFIEALANRQAAEKLIGAIIPDGWPDAELAGLLQVYGPWVAADPLRLGYVPGRSSRATAGRSLGAARALISWGLRQPDVGRIIAKCDPA